ncbi:MAG: DUF6538 domain-containing protein [Pseudomonadota bacterium]
MAANLGRGLFRKTRDGVWHARRAVPKDLRHKFGWERIESLRTKDSEQAERRRDDFWRKCDAEFEDARATTGSLIELRHVLAAVEVWRRDRCAAARTGVVDPPPALVPGFTLPGKVFQSLERKIVVADLAAPRPAREPALGPDLRRVAEAYFEHRPDVSRELLVPAPMVALMGKLQVACRDPDAWERIDDFDSQMGAALRDGGMEVTYDHE